MYRVEICYMIDGRPPDTLVFHVMADSMPTASDKAFTMLVEEMGITWNEISYFRINPYKVR